MKYNKHIAILHLITQDGLDISHEEQALRACKAGVKWVQLRMKNCTYDQYFDVAEKVKKICQKYGATFIINDNVDVALNINADGVHLGKEDMPPAEAREILGEEKIIGGTANTTEDVEYLASKNVDYIGLGPFKYTSTKEKLSPILGLEGYTSIDERCKTRGIDIPKIAIGGVLPDDVKNIMETGMHGVAVASAINQAEDVTSIVNQYLKEIAYAPVSNS